MANLLLQGPNLNPAARGGADFKLIFSDKAVGTIVGLAPRGYEDALDRALSTLR